MQSYILLDRSGSMGARWTEALSSINSYVKGLQEAKGDYSVTVATFDTSTEILPLTSKIEPVTTVINSQIAAKQPAYPQQVSTFDVIRNNVSVNDWKDLTDKEIAPRGGTPLYDATAKLVNLVKQTNPDRAVLVIMTDGEENSSREVSQTVAKNMLDECRNKNWQVIFLGADFENARQASNLGSVRGMAISASGANLRNTMEKTAFYASNYASTGSTMNFTDEDRASAVAIDTSKMFKDKLKAKAEVK